MSSLSKQTTLYRAPWLVPVTSPIIADGGVLVGGGRILAVGPFRSLQRDADLVVELDGALLPRLINCHSHLELSAYGDSFKALLTEGPPETFPAWIRELLYLRAETVVEPSELKLAAADLFRRMAKEGVALVLDTGNLAESDGFAADIDSRHRFLLEMLGLSDKAAATKISELEQLAPGQTVTAHAPYSTHPDLMRAIKARCRQNGQLFSIHTAESPEESEFLAANSGPFVDFLTERGVLDSGFQAPGCSPVQYLERLGLLDDRTLCVHCVQVRDADLEILARRHSGVCLCPGSNASLGVGRAPVEKMGKAGIRLCLGTDSLTSNPHCSMWYEMQLLGREHPGLEPERIISMATMGGAAVLEVEKYLGSLETGKLGAMVLVRQHFSDQRQLLESVVASGPGLQVETVGLAYD